MVDAITYLGAFGGVCVYHGLGMCSESVETFLDCLHIVVSSATRLGTLQKTFRHRLVRQLSM